MRLEHVAIWTRDTASLERLRDFYTTHFGARAGPRYASARRAGFASYFLTFPADGGGCAARGARVELMTVPGLVSLPAGERCGYAHLALALRSRDEVDALLARLGAADVRLESPPRLTGDGYYEAVVRDPDGNVVEIMAEPEAEGAR